MSKLDDLFGLRKTFASPILDQWLQAEVALSEKERGMVESFQELLILNSDAWIAQELSLHFIGPMLALTHFIEPYLIFLPSARSARLSLATTATSN